MSDKPKFWILLDSKQLHICFRAEQSSCWWQIIVITAGGRMHPRHRQETLREPSRNTVTDAAPVLLLPHTGNKVFKQPVVFRPSCSRIRLDDENCNTNTFWCRIIQLFTVWNGGLILENVFLNQLSWLWRRTLLGTFHQLFLEHHAFMFWVCPRQGGDPKFQSKDERKDRETRAKVTRWDPFPNNVYGCCIFVLLKDFSSVLLQQNFSVTVIKGRMFTSSFV